MKAMLLAAGLGTRLRPITETYAKPAVPFLNVPMIYYAMELLEEAGVDQFVANSHYKADQIHSLITQAPGLQKKPSITFEPGQPLGSGGGIWNARDELRNDRQAENFWLANADEIILPHDIGILEKLRTRHEKSGAIATILVMRDARVGTQFGGVWADESGRVRGFGKSGSTFGDKLNGYHYIGLQILNQRIFEFLPEGESNILYDALTSAIKAGEKVDVLVGNFTWFETGNPKDFVEASISCMKLLHQPELAQGNDREFLLRVLARFSKNASAGQVVWHAPTSQVPLASNAIVLAAPGARVDSGAHLSGYVVLGKNSIVEKDASVSDSVILDHATVSSALKIDHFLFI